MTTPASESKHHVLVICDRRFNSEQLWTALGILHHRGHTFEVVSTDTTICEEKTQKPFTIKRTVYEVKDFTGYDGVLVISGHPHDTRAYWNDKHVLSIIASAQTRTAPIGAICGAVPTVRYAAKGKRVSFYPLAKAREYLESVGAIPQTVSVTVDGNLITAEHEIASSIWAEEFCNLLEGKPQQHHLHDSGYVPRGKPRKPIPQLEKIKAVMANRDQDRDGETS